MLRHLKSVFLALGLTTTAGLGVAAADTFVAPTVDIYAGSGGVAIGAGVHVTSRPDYQTVDYRHGYDHRPGPNYVIPSNAPPVVAYPQDLRPRRGFTWVPARYEHRYGRMVYVPGHWERVRARRNMVWVEDHVESRHGRAVYVPGHWERVRGRGNYGYGNGYGYSYR